MNSNTVNTLNQYLTFTLNKELFALDISWVKEILSNVCITKVPRMPKYILGVINVRGHAIPVVDLHAKFETGKSNISSETCVIIIEVEMADEVVVIGALADTVQEVIELKDDQINPPPKIGTSIDTKFLKGFGKKDEGFIIILDTNCVFADEEIETIKATTNCKENN